MTNSSEVSHLTDKELFMQRWEQEFPGSSAQAVPEPRSVRGL
jgi:hypothetical protein